MISVTTSYVDVFHQLKVTPRCDVLILWVRMHRCIDDLETKGSAVYEPLGVWCIFRDFQLAQPMCCAICSLRYQTCQPLGHLTDYESQELHIAWLAHPWTAQMCFVNGENQRKPETN